MSYITLANLKSIVRKTDLKSFEIQKELYRIPIYFYSKYEKNYLLSIRELLEDPKKWFRDIYVPSKKEIDTFTFVYEGKPPAYHTTHTCERLLSDYRNFKIPEEIRIDGEEKVIEFRNWFETVKYLFEGDPEVFIARLHARFEILTNISAISFENSGPALFANSDIEQMEGEIDKLINASGKFFDASKKNTEILNEFSKMTFLANPKYKIYNNKTRYDDDEVKSLLKEYDERFKKPLTENLIQYYRLKLNPDIELMGQILDNLGFGACGSCLLENSLQSLKDKPIVPIEHVPVDYKNISLKSRAAKIRGKKRKIYSISSVNSEAGRFTKSINQFHQDVNSLLRQNRSITPTVHFITKSIRSLIKIEYSDIVIADIKNYYPSIDHELILKIVNNLTSKENFNILKALLDIYKKETNNNSGLPTGINIASSLGELFLIDIDQNILKEKENYDFKYFRYVDNIIFLFRRQKYYSSKIKKRIIDQFKHKIEEKKLVLNYCNNVGHCIGVEDFKDFNYLGFRHSRTKVGLSNNFLKRIKGTITLFLFREKNIVSYNAVHIINRLIVGYTICKNSKKAEKYRCSSDFPKIWFSLAKYLSVIDDFDDVKNLSSWIKKAYFSIVENEPTKKFESLIRWFFIYKKNLKSGTVRAKKFAGNNYVKVEVKDNSQDDIKLKGKNKLIIEKDVDSSGSNEAENNNDNLSGFWLSDDDIDSDQLDSFVHLVY